MGYPPDIVNAMPKTEPLPASGPWIRACARWREIFRRKRLRIHAPENYAQGVDRKGPPLSCRRG